MQINWKIVAIILAGLVILFLFLLQSSYNKYSELEREYEDYIQSNTKESVEVVSGAERCSEILEEEYKYCDNRVNECKTFFEGLLNEEIESCNNRVDKCRANCEELLLIG